MHKTIRNKIFGGILALLCVTLLAVGTNSWFDNAPNNAALPSSPQSPPQTAILAKEWAEGWKTRDGSLRTAVMSQKMLTAFREAQSNDTGDPDNTVIRGSSPWVAAYSIQPDGHGMRINYTYADSRGDRYSSSERLLFSSENGKTVVSDCVTLQDLKKS
ncbi:hypothetical protein CDO73_00205 [Saccharibacillus sp. O23]|uniref:hypothetical protein n=1 Tax=Saccharibacillus sp. O23 TaxID=2009338 RepID=UPI000B4E4A2E|nr:hypothetical protein [Saccharibacillus sp. O23]OWR32968.1 hypothetical protein CDO73_00205 [Saccharibacillus sp. O23]